MVRKVETGGNQNTQTESTEVTRPPIRDRALEDDLDRRLRAAFIDRP